MRRTKPSKRAHDVLVAVDDSQSVALGGAGALVLEAVATLLTALRLVEVGQLGLLKFGDTVQLLHGLDEPWTDEAAARTFPQLQFHQQRTNMLQLLERAQELLADARQKRPDAPRQLLFIVSDGRFGDERARLRQALRLAHEQRLLTVFLAVDVRGGRESLFDVQSVSWAGGKLSMTPYLDDFPFAYYLVLRDLAALPHVLADALRQWFELLSRNEAF